MAKPTDTNQFPNLVTCRLSDETLAVVEIMAERADESRSEFIRNRLRAMAYMYAREQNDETLDALIQRGM